MCDFYKSIIFKKQRQWNPVKKIFDISELFIQHNTDSYCEHIAGVVNMLMYIYMRESVYWTLV